MTNKNKWILVTVYALLAVIVILTAVSYFVQVSHRPEIKDPQKYSIQVENQAIYDDADKNLDQEKYKKLNDAFNKSFKESFLISLFSGRNGYESTIIQLNPATFKGYKVTLYYPEEQVVMLNGKEYSKKTDTQENVTYHEIIFSVQEGLGMSEQYVYYAHEYNSESGPKTVYYRQTIIANFDEFYNAIGLL